MKKAPPPIVRVHRPELTPEERDKRMKAIHDAAVRLYLAAAKARKENAQNETRGL